MPTCRPLASQLPCNLALLRAPAPLQLHLISVLESGLANDVVGESAADSSPDCKPDPIALQKTQDLLQVRCSLGFVIANSCSKQQSPLLPLPAAHCCASWSCLKSGPCSAPGPSSAPAPGHLRVQRCKGEAQGAGIKNVKMTTLVSCAGGSADMVSVLRPLELALLSSAMSDVSDSKCWVQGSLEAQNCI